MQYPILFPDRTIPYKVSSEKLKDLTKIIESLNDIKLINSRGNDSLPKAKMINAKK